MYACVGVCNVMHLNDTNQFHSQILQAHISFIHSFGDSFISAFIYLHQLKNTHTYTYILYLSIGTSGAYTCCKIDVANTGVIKNE